MQKELLKNYHFDGFIDTVNVWSEDEDILSDISKEYSLAVKPRRNKKTDTGTIRNTVTINPNALLDPNNNYKRFGNAETFSEFEATMNSIISNTNISPDIDYRRCDFACNSTDPNFYNQFAKLHRYLLACLAEGNGIRDNVYESNGLFDLNLRSISIKHSNVEVEYYDKNIESKGKEDIQARLEFRTTRMRNNDIPKEFLNRWNNRLNRALKATDKVQQNFNAILLKKWLENKDRKPYMFKSENEFIRRYQELIFTRKQLIDLYKLIDEKTDLNVATEKAKAFKRYNGIIYISKKDLQAAIEEIKRSIRAYFEN